MTGKYCPINKMQPCFSDCNWYLKNEDECAVVAIAIFTNNPPKDKEY